jgi:hypothetical protein
VFGEIFILESFRLTFTANVKPLTKFLILQLYYNNFYTKYMEIEISMKIGFPYYFPPKIHTISIVKILKKIPVINWRKNT